MSIEIDGVEYRTAAQWERVHRHVRKGSKGIERKWISPRGMQRAVFFNVGQTRPWSKKDLSRQRRERAEERRRRAEERLGAEIRQSERLRLALEVTHCPEDALDESRDWIMAPHTAWQWVSAGFVPVGEAMWRRIGPDEVCVCCRVWDTRWDPARAAELIKTGPVDDRLPDGRWYCGQPWW